MMKVSHDERNTQLKVLKTPDLLGLIQVYDINIIYYMMYASVFISIFIVDTLEWTVGTVS